MLAARALRLSLTAALPLLVAGCPAPAGQPHEVAGALARLDPAVRRVAGLEPEGPLLVRSEWYLGASMPLALVRQLHGWEVEDGAPCARFGVVVATKEREGDVTTEWLRPAGDRLLCATRALRGQRVTLAPPQPLLVAPLEAGQTWRWEGTVDGAPASVDFEVLRAGEEEVEGERVHAVVVSHTIRAAGLEVSRAQTWAAGRGLVREEGALPGPEAGEALEPFKVLRWVDGPTSGD